MVSSVNNGFDWNNYTRFIAQRESGGKPYVKNSQAGQTASGLFQFTKDTWKGLGGSWGNDDSKAFGGLMPTPQEQGIRLRKFSEQNKKVLEKNGVPVTDGTMYLAHFLGASTAAKILKQPDNAIAANYVSQNAVNANGNVLRGTVGQLKNWANGGKQPMPTNGFDWATLAMPDASMYNAPNLQGVNIGQIMSMFKAPQSYQKLNLPDAPKQDKIAAPPKLEQRDIAAELKDMAMLAPQIPGGMELFQTGLAAAATAASQADPRNAGAIIAAMGGAFAAKKQELQKSAETEMRKFNIEMFNQKMAANAENRNLRNQDATNAYNADVKNSEIDFNNRNRQYQVDTTEQTTNNQLANRYVDNMSAFNNSLAQQFAQLQQYNTGVENNQAQMGWQGRMAYNNDVMQANQYNATAANQQNQFQQELGLRKAALDASAGEDKIKQQEEYVKQLATKNFGFTDKKAVKLFETSVGSREGIYGSPAYDAQIRGIANRIQAGEDPNLELTGEILNSQEAMNKIPQKIRTQIQNLPPDQQLTQLGMWLAKNKKTRNSASDIAASSSSTAYVARMWKVQRHGSAGLKENVIKAAKNAINPLGNVENLSKILIDAVQYRDEVDYQNIPVPNFSYPGNQWTF